MTSNEILNQFFLKKNKSRKNFSLRMLARKMELSPSYLSKILRGQKPVPNSRISEFAKYLEMDTYAKRRLQRTLLKEQDWDVDAQQTAEMEIPAASERYKRAEPDALWLLEKWYYLPLLALLDCDHFRGEPAWIADQLGLKKEIADQAWQRLLDSGIIAKGENGWQKVQSRMIFPNGKANIMIQKFYGEMFAKTCRVMTEARAEDFGQRMILGASVSTNPESFEKAKKYLEEALCRAGELLDDGPRTQVYYLAAQLIPLTR